MPCPCGHCVFRLRVKGSAIIWGGDFAEIADQGSPHYADRVQWGDCPRGDRIRTPVSYVISASSSLLGSKLISPGSDLSLKVISILAVNFLEQVATAHLTNPGEIMSLATLLTLRECPHGREILALRVASIQRNREMRLRCFLSTYWAACCCLRCLKR